MTRDDLTSIITPLARHGLTVVAGILAAKGFQGGADQINADAGAAISAGIALAWSFAEKSKLLTAAFNAAPFDDVQAVATMLGQFRAGGASPLLVAHMAGTLAALAAAEVPVVAAPAVPAAPTPTPATADQVQAAIAAAAQVQADPAALAAAQAAANSQVPPAPVVGGAFLPAGTHGDGA